MEKFKLGTRRSLLAWAQSSWVAREIERLNPGTQVELVGIDTRGDKIVDVSLRTLAGKEFFVAELDDALRESQVDFTVHSMKDLSLERPANFVLAAIPPRENPRDVILFGPGVMEKIRVRKTLKIGTSSPRRLENIPPFLAKGLPTVGGVSPSVEMVEIRGNVNTRLSRVHEPAGSDKALDGVVLAFAGMIRLWADDKGRAELSKLLQGVRWIVMPLKECPAAPAQGALAVECRANDQRTRAVLSTLHDPETAVRVASERQLLADWGGGCHQKFGATAIRTRELDHVLFVRGRKPDETFVDEIRWKKPQANLSDRELVWNGSEFHAKAQSGAEESQKATIPGRAVFVAHSRAFPKNHAEQALTSRVWTSGASSWFKLAAQGVWVEGCAEGLGFEFLEPTLREKVLQLPAFGLEWTVLTHEAAREGWGNAHVVATYRVAAEPDPGQRAGVERARHFYWSSGSQFDQYRAWVPAGSHHYSGPGKTAAHLRKNGLSPVVFPSAEEWKKWIRK